MRSRSEVNVETNGFSGRCPEQIPLFGGNNRQKPHLPNFHRVGSTANETLRQRNADFLQRKLATNGNCKEYRAEYGPRPDQ